MSELDRVVGGLRCRDVLELLADYVDGDLDPSMSARVDEHLRGCDACEKFGGEYGDLVARLRAGLGVAQPDREARARLDAHMSRVWAEETDEPRR